MAEVVPVADPTDPRLRDYVDLRDVQLRKLLETERGLFLAEGEKVVRRAVVSGHSVRSFLMAPRWLDALHDVLSSTGAPCYVLPEAQIEKVTGFHVHRGALASLDRLPLPPASAVLAGAHRIVVVEDVVDHTNVGAIFRSVAALGFDAVLLSPRCADPLYRRAIKVSMGAVFTLPYARLTHWGDLPELLAQHGFTTVALSLAAGSTSLDGLTVGGKVALLVGSEGDGLSPHWTHSADHRAVIPMAAGIDSLNVAAAVAVACWTLGRPRARRDGPV